MEMEDDMIVLVIASDEDKHLNNEVQNENLEVAEFGNILETAKKHGVYLGLDVKVEPEDDSEENQSKNKEEHLQEKEKFNIGEHDITFNYQEYIKREENVGYKSEEDEYIPKHVEFIHGYDKYVHKHLKQEEQDLKIEKQHLKKEKQHLKKEKQHLKKEKQHLKKDKQPVKKKRRCTKSKRLTTSYIKEDREIKSFVEDLRQEYEELRNDDGKLIDTLEQIMRSTKPPELPKDYYVINGISIECVYCGHLSQTMPVANRHYHEKHGPRYLICYACGDDFRSIINLYKHEKRCKAADADIVLQARAAAIGSKARSRPFLWRAEGKLCRLASNHLNKIKQHEYPCTHCSAVFTTSKGLKAHNNMHRGVRPYRCQNCPRAYTSMDGLTRHMQGTHSDAQFICDHCSRSFKTKPNLIVHLNTHLPQRKYACLECDRRFAQKSALRWHVNKVHKNLPPPCACQVCPKRYPRMSHLKDHMKKVHGLDLITREMFIRNMPAMTDAELKQKTMCTV